MGREERDGGGAGIFFKTVIDRDFISRSKCAKILMAPGLCPGPLRELKRPSRPPAAVGGQIRKHFLKLLSRSLRHFAAGSRGLGGRKMKEGRDRDGRVGVFVPKQHRN